MFLFLIETILILMVWFKNEIIKMAILKKFCCCCFTFIHQIRKKFLSFHREFIVVQNYSVWILHISKNNVPLFSWILHCFQKRTCVVVWKMLQQKQKACWAFSGTVNAMSMISLCYSSQWHHLYIYILIYNPKIIR